MISTPVPGAPGGGGARGGSSGPSPSTASCRASRPSLTCALRWRVTRGPGEQDMRCITSWRWSAPYRASKSVSPERAGRASSVSLAAPAPTPGAGPPASGPPVAAPSHPPLRRAPHRSTGLPLPRFLTRCLSPAAAAPGERQPRGEAARARGPASVPAPGAAARGGPSSNRDVFSHGSTGQCSKVKVSQGRAPSGGCRGGSFLPPPASGSCGRPWACGRVPPVSASAHQSLDLGPIRIIQDDLKILNYTCKDPFSK